MYAYKTTYGSNLDPEDDAMDIFGNLLSLESDVYQLWSNFGHYAHLHRASYCQREEYNFRGATLHGLNQTILTLTFGWLQQNKSTGRSF